MPEQRHEWRWTQNIIDGWLIYRCPTCGEVRVRPGQYLPAHIDGWASDPRNPDADCYADLPPHLRGAQDDGPGEVAR